MEENCNFQGRGRVFNFFFFCGEGMDDVRNNTITVEVCVINEY